MIELGFGTEEHWHSLAAGISLGQDLARVRRDQAAATYLDLAADALNEITSRHSRVGGRWGSTAQEIADIRNGLIIVSTLCTLSNSAQAIPAIQRVAGMPIGTLLKVVKAREATEAIQPAGDQ